MNKLRVSLRTYGEMTESYSELIIILAFSTQLTLVVGILAMELRFSVMLNNETFLQCSNVH